MVFVDESVVIEGTTYWPIHTVPVEERPGGQPLLGVEVEVTAVDGATIVIRDAGSREVVPSTFLSSAVYGTTPNLYSPVPTVRMVTSVGIPLFVTSVAYINLQATVVDLVARAEAAEASASALLEQANLAAQRALMAQQAAEAAAGSGGGGSGTAGGLYVVRAVNGAYPATESEALAAAGAAGPQPYFIGPRDVAPPAWIADGDPIGLTPPPVTP